MKSVLLLSICAIFCVNTDNVAFNKNQNIKSSKEMKIEIDIDGQILMAVLYDNQTANDLIAQLPAEIVLEDYANTEKIFYPAKKLSTHGAPSGYKPRTGDITYYGPWGDIAIFYKDFGFASGLVSVGRIDEDDIHKLKFSGNKKAIIKLVKN